MYSSSRYYPDIYLERMKTYKNPRQDERQSAL
jgi:hypothetical protein